jgi:S1-C subfamily serine protease
MMAFSGNGWRVRFHACILVAALTAGPASFVAVGTAGAAEKDSTQDVISSVVAISAVIPDDARTVHTLGGMRSGSGIVIDDDGLVLTIGYLILEAEKAAVTNAEVELVPAALVAYDHATGFGLLRAEQPLGLNPVKLGASADLSEGTNVIVVSKGGPMPVMRARVASRREFAGYWEYLLDNAIFTVPPFPQYGGAALIDRDGRLVGVGSLMVNDAAGPDAPVPGNMFVPIDLLKPILDELLEIGRVSATSHPWLGIYTNENNGRGIVVRLATDGPAAEAGIRPGDIIIGVGGRRVSGIADFYRKIRAQGGAGAEIPIDLLPVREGGLDIKTIKVFSRDRHDWLKLNKKKL